MTSVVEPDQGQLSILQAMLHGSTAYDSLAALNEHLRTTPNEFAVVIGPSISTDDAATFAQWARVARPHLGVILLRHVVDSAALSTALRSGMREVVQAKDLAGITTAVQRARSVASAINETLEVEAQAAAEAAALAAREEAERAAAAAAEQARAAEAAAAVPKGTLTTVFSNKGGVGKSLIATNLAVALADEGHEVCLVDLDLNNGDVAIMLQLSPSRSVHDLVAFGGDIDDGSVQSILTRHSSRLAIAAAPVTLDAPEKASAEAVGSMLDVLREQFEHVVVDTSGVFDDYALAALDRSDAIVLVATLDIPSLKGLKLATNTLDLLNFPRETWTFVLNRADAKVGLTVDEFESTLGLKADYQLVSSREVLAAVNRGEALVSAFPTHANTKTIKRLAASLTVVPTEEESRAGGRKATPKRLRLRRA